MTSVLTLPQDTHSSLSIRAKALLFHDRRSIELLHQVERVARSDATVLVYGETGTGKELIARHIHKVSARAGPFVAVNCGAFSENLIDAELFGHEAGAFTGAARARAGWFEAAHGGTLFLDEIGDLPLPLQVKLLRVLQERQVVRLGSTRATALDVRLVAATNLDLVEAVQAQHFRADLYYRLSVTTVALPPLRDRVGDILPLVDHFLGVYSARLGVPRHRLSEEARAALLGYSWPGNIRELENVVHRAVIVCRGDSVQEADLHLSAPSLSYPGPVARERPAAPDDRRGGFGELDRAFEELLRGRAPDLQARVERALVHAAFRHCGDNQVQAARALGITRNTMRTLLKRHGLLETSGSDASALPASPRAALHAVETAQRAAPAANSDSLLVS